MPLLTVSGPLRPTFKLTLFEREAYTFKEIVAIVRQEGRQAIQLPDGTKKPVLKRLWAKQDQLLVEQSQADYVSVPGEDGYDPEDKLTRGWKTRHAALLRKLAAGKVDATGDEIKETKQEKENAEVNMTDVDDADDEPITDKRTIAEMMQDLEKWGRLHKGVRRAEPLRAIWVSEIRARRRKESQEDRDAESDKADHDADVDVTSDPESSEAPGASPRKRKRKETSNDRVTRKRTKVGAAKSVEVEDAVHGDELEDEDAPMIDAEDEVAIESKPQRKKAMPRKKSASQAKGSKRHAASKCTINDIVHEAPRRQLLEVSKGMDNSTSKENTVAIQGKGEIASPTVGRTRGAVGKKATTAPPVCPEPSHPEPSVPITAARKKKVNLDPIDEDDEDEEDEDEDSDQAETLPAPSGRGGRRAASKAPASTHPTRSLRSNDAPAQDTTETGPAHKKDKNEKQEDEEVWVQKHKTDNYNNYIPLSVTLKINPDTLEYPLLMTWKKNIKKLARRKAKKEGMPWPPVSTKKPKYDYRKDPNWRIPED